MLEHEPQQIQPTPASPIPAAERRVSAEELTRAVTALEDAKAAERVAGVAPIGQVVEELGLDSTPEEIWAQVQKQRAQVQKQRAQEAAAQMPTVQAAVVHPAIRPHRRRGRWYVLFALVCVVYGLSHNEYVAMQHAPPDVTSPSPAITLTNPGSTITISGQDQTETIPVQGKDVVIFRAKMSSLKGKTTISR